jgi:UDP-GlcNAc:undecaprenyl-phosphate GlcNAc-1-phosphate transferase
LLLTLLVAWVAATLLTPVLRRVASATGFVAVPSARGVHRAPTPLLGGAAIFLAFVLALAAGAGLSKSITPERAFGFLGGATLVFAMGIIDDRVNLGWFSKLLGQIVAAILLLASDNSGGIFLLSPLGLAFALVWIVGLANAMNFLDNMDGLCAGISLVASLTFVVLGALEGDLGTALFAAAVAGATLGFLRFNFPPASIFLGDGGSLFLGYTLASLGVMTARNLDFSFSLLVPAVALAYPIFDITFVSVTRVSRGQSLTQGGRDHTSHRLARLVGGPRATAWIIYGICGVVGLLAVALEILAFAPATVVALIGVVFSFVAFGIRLCRRAPVPDASAQQAGPAVS